jgi:hypothetical protein
MANAMKIAEKKKFHASARIAITTESCTSKNESCTSVLLAFSYLADTPAT